MKASIPEQYIGFWIGHSGLAPVIIVMFLHAEIVRMQVGHLLTRTSCIKREELNVSLQWQE